MTDTIHGKLRKVQMELKAPKSQRNNFGNYNYRSCEDILEAVKPLLDAQGLTLIINDTIENIGDRYYVKASAGVTDGEKEIIVSAFAREEETKRGMDGAQITGSASSYARKYALNGLFNIDDTKDADTHDNTKHVSKPAQPKIATAKMKFDLQQSMKDKGMGSDTMGMFVESVINKEKLETEEDYKAVVAALEEQ